ncbi:MAG: hypothetical protein U0271_29435 [Polyangiaceae bacterium]
MQDDGEQRREPRGAAWYLARVGALTLSISVVGFLMFRASGLGCSSDAASSATPESAAPKSSTSAAKNNTPASNTAPPATSSTVAATSAAPAPSVAASDAPASATTPPAGQKPTHPKQASSDVPFFGGSKAAPVRINSER